MTTIRYLVVVAALMSSSLFAQRLPTRANFKDPDRNGSRLFYTTRASGAAAQWVWKIGHIESIGQTVLPSAICGGATEIDQNTLLVTGFTGPDGWIAEVTFALTGGAIQSSIASVSAGPIDLVKPCFDPVAGLLYAIDNTTKELLVANYSPGLNLGPWQVIAAAVQCPLLRETNWASIALIPGVVGVRVTGREPFETFRPIEITRDSSGNWSVSDPFLGFQTPMPPTWFVSAFPLMVVDSSEYRLWIGGGVGPFSIIDKLTGAAVFSGVHGGTPAGEEFSVPVTALESGKMYYVAGAPGSGYHRSGLFRAEHVWRRAVMDPNMVPATVSIRTDFPVVGTDFVGWDLYWATSVPQPTEPMLVTMFAGGWEFGINPTATLPGVGDVLAVSYGDLGAQTASWNNRGRISFGWPISINNPSFAGLKVAVQAVGVLPSGQFIVSDVAGVQLVH